MSASLQVRADVLRLAEYSVNGFLLYQYDAYGENQSGVPAVEAWSQYGSYSRPPDPELDEAGEVKFAAQLLVFWEGAESYAIALHDPRLVPGLPQLLGGEYVSYGKAFNFTRWHADGRISTMCTTDGTANGKSVQHEHAPDGWTWSAPWAVQRNDASGFYYRHASGARLEGGSIGGLPAPLDTLASYWRLEAAIVSIRGTAVKLGVGTYEPPAKALTLQAALTTLAEALTATGSALTGPGAPAAVAAITAAVAAIAGLATTMPARSVQVA